MIDHSNFDAALEVLNDVSRDYPLKEKTVGMEDLITNLLAERVRRTLKNLLEKYQEQATESLDLMAGKYGEELREMGKE